MSRKVVEQNLEVSTGIKIETCQNVLPNIFIKGKIAKVSTGGKSFDGWQNPLKPLDNKIQIFELKIYYFHITNEQIVYSKDHVLLKYHIIYLQIKNKIKKFTY